jgi:hypothetical protein
VSGGWPTQARFWLEWGIVEFELCKILVNARLWCNSIYRQRGQLAEIVLMRKAASLGLSIAKPWGEGERVDFIANFENTCWRIQVKSVLAKAPSTHHYRVRTISRNGHQRYSANDIDFLVAYIFPEHLWYVFPTSVVESRSLVCVVPGSNKSRNEQYREAWYLMKPVPRVTTVEQPVRK